MRVLLCDDSAAYRAALRAALASDPAIELVGEAATGEEAVQRARELRPDVILMDMGLPRLNGIEATRLIVRALPQVRVIGLTAYAEASVVIPMIEAGARGFCLKGGPVDDLRKAIAATESATYLDDRAVGNTLQEVARLYRSNRDATSELTATRARLEESLAAHRRLTRGVVQALASAVELRDGYTARHASRVTSAALLLTAVVAPDLVGNEALEYGYLLHDVGKLGVPDAILNKAPPFTEEEAAVMRSHVRHGVDLLAHIPELDVARQVIAHHHERWDGGGYPAGLAGEAIPLGARIFAVCDAYDAMTSDRPYRAAIPPEAARAEVARQAGAHFDPQVAAAFLKLLESVELADVDPVPPATKPNNEVPVPEVPR